MYELPDMWSTLVQIRIVVRGPPINARGRDVHANVNNPNGKKNSECQGNGFGFPYARRGQRRTTTNQPALTLTLYPYRNVFHGRIATKAERRVKVIKVLVCRCNCYNLEERREKKVTKKTLHWTSFFIDMKIQRTNIFFINIVCSM